MIISGGQNIYPADIEALLNTPPQVSDVAVVGAASKRWGETPVAVLVLKDASGFESEELIGWANARLGKQQRIAGVEVIEELPRNPNGKVLKRELRERFAARVFD